MISGDLFPITNMTDIHLSDFCIINNAAAGANAAIRLNYGQFSVFDRLWISGLFAVGIELDTSSTSGGSTIRNTFRDVFITSLAPNGIGCLLNSSDATSKVINNNAFWMVACQGGSSNGVGLKVTNSNTTQNINENFFYGDEFATTGGSLGTGIGIQFTTGATRGMTFIGANVESNGTGLNKANQNTVSFLGGNFSSNGTNVIDSQQAFSQFIGTNVGGTVQQFAVDPGGGIDVNCIGVNASCVGQTNILNVGSGFQLTVATAAQAFLDTTGFRLRSVTFANLPAATNGTEIFCSDCNATCAAGASTGRTCFRENGAWTH